MKTLLLSIVLITASFANAQSSNTFFIQEKNDNNVKLVLKTGDKLIVKSDGYKVKGKITKITADSLMIGDKNIALNDISRVSKHKIGMKIISAIGVAVSVTLMTAWFTAEQGGLFQDGNSAGLIFIFPAAGCTVPLVLPRVYSGKDYFFKTYIELR